MRGVLVTLLKGFSSRIWRAGFLLVVAGAGFCGRAEEQHSVMTAEQSTTLSGYVDTSASWWFGTPGPEVGVGVTREVIFYDLGGALSPQAPYSGPGESIGLSGLGLTAPLSDGRKLGVAEAVPEPSAGALIVVAGLAGLAMWSKLKAREPRIF